MTVRRSALTERIESGSASALIDRLVATYGGPAVDPSPVAWEALLADDGFDTQPVAVLEFVRLRLDTDASTNYDLFLTALTAAAVTAGGELLSINDTLMPGLADLEGYEGGVSWVATFPSARAYVDVLLDERVIAVAGKRRAAVAEANLLLGPNLVPDIIRQLPANQPASAFPSGRVTGKSPQQIVDDVLAVYPAGGADPTRETLEAMVAFRGFADQRLHFINLYRFNAASGGEAALNEYGAKGGAVALAHGARPKVAANVAHHLVGPVAWNRFIFVSWPSFAVFTDLRLDPIYIEEQKKRVASAAQYGNLITIARADRPMFP